MSKALAVVLARVGLINERQLETLVAKAELENRDFLGLIMEAGMASDQDIARCLALTLKVPLVHPLPMRIPREVLSRIPASFATSRMVLPLEVNERENLFTVALADPTDQELQDELAFRSGMQLRICVAGYHELEQVVRRHYLSGDRNERTISASRNIDIGDLFFNKKGAAGGAGARSPSGIPTSELGESGKSRTSGEKSPSRLEMPTRSPSRIETRSSSETVVEPGQAKPEVPLNPERVVSMQTQTDLYQQLRQGLEDRRQAAAGASPAVVVDLLKQLLARIIELESRIGEISRAQQDLVELLIKDGLLSRKAYLEWLNSRS